MKYNRIAYPGEFTHTQGPFKMDVGTFESIVNQFKQRRAKPIADYDHFSEGSASKGDGDKIAAGHVVDLKIMNGDLYAAISWTERAKRKIVNREYAYLSPAIVFNGVGSDGKVIPARLSSIGLVNRPFLHQLEPVLASDNGSVAICCSEISDTEIAELAAVELSDEHAEELVTLADLNAAVLRETELFAAQLHDAETAAAVAEARAVALEAQIKLMNDKGIDETVETAFQNYRESRKLSHNAKRVMRLTLLSDPDLFVAEYPPMPKHVPSYMTRTLSDVGDAVAIAGVKTVPTLASLIESSKAAHPNEPFDRQFDIALAQHTSMLGQSTGALH
jgi:phage I-like protein